MKNRVCVILPFFGKMNNYFYLWLNSAIANPDFDFLILTDSKISQNKCANIKIIATSISYINSLISVKIGSEYKIVKPYKLCDYRPAFGFLFQDYLSNYDFWGWCDCDMIFGNISSFITDDILDKYYKINYHGHFCLLKNTSYINKLFMHNIGKIIPYKTIFRSKFSFCFDEFVSGGFPKICEIENIPVFYKRTFADINPYCSHFTFKWYDNEVFIENYCVDFFEYFNGHLYFVKDMSKKEILYVHLGGGRKMGTSKITHNFTHFYIYPNFFSNNKINNDSLVNERHFHSLLKKKRKKQFYQKLLFSLWLLFSLNFFNKYWRLYL